MAVTGLVGLGALLALAPDSPQRLEELLFGDPLGVTDGDLVAARRLLLLGGGALAALHRPLAAVAFDPGGAAAAGLAPARWCGSRCSTCSPRPSRWRCRASARCWCSPSWSRRRSRCAPHVAHARARRCWPAPPSRCSRRSIGMEVSFHAHSAAGASVALALCARGGARRAAQAVAACGTSRRTATIAAPSASIARPMSCASVRPATTSSLRRMNSTRKRSTPAIIR